MMNFGDLLTLSSCVRRKLPLLMVTPYVDLDTVLSRFIVDAFYLEIALLDPGLLLSGTAVASDFFICASDRSTLRPPPILKNELKDLEGFCDFPSYPYKFLSQSIPSVNELVIC
jgi:hypothetical protein